MCAYMPLYGTCWDNQVGDGHTSSRRGIVDEVGLDCNTHFGKCVNVGIHYINGENYVDRPDFRKFKKGTVRDEAKKKYEDEVDEKTSVYVGISLKEDKHFVYSIEGVKMDNGRKEVLTALADEEILKAVKETIEHVKFAREI